MKKRRAQHRFTLARRIAMAGILCARFAWAEAHVASSAESVPAEASPDTAALRFAETCMGCHTVGGGVARGPDLAGVVAWPEAQLATAVKSMERKVGPLSAQQVEALVGLLKDAALQQRIAKAKAQLSMVSEPSSAAVDSLLGGAIFFGRKSLQNGGMACSSCHRYRGEGGDLGPELSHFAEHAELDVLAGTIARASFPVMRAAYEIHPITQQEARHLAAFMQQAKARRIVAPFSEIAAWGLGAGLGAFAMTLALILTRPKGVRARLIQRATKR